MVGKNVARVGGHDGGDGRVDKVTGRANNYWNVKTYIY